MPERRSDIRIDSTRYAAFWANPEKYRLTYERDLAPVETPFPLARGIHLHSLHEARNKSLTPDETNLLILKNEGISKKAQDVGTAMYTAFKRKYDGDKRFKLMFADGKPLAELEFDVPIPGSPHSMVGKMDEIIEFEGELWNGDLKTANAKASEARKKTEFNLSMQPNFYINACRLMGYPVVGSLYRVVTEHTPPQHWIIKVKRSDHELKMALLAIHQTCEIIEFCRKTFGSKIPWPHLSTGYPCNYGDACEYKGICNRADADLDSDDLSSFKTRIDHLENMR